MPLLLHPSRPLAGLIARRGEADVALAPRASFAHAACAETAPPVARRGRRASGEDEQHDSWQLSMALTVCTVSARAGVVRTHDGLRRDRDVHATS